MPIRVGDILSFWPFLLALIATLSGSSHGLVSTTNEFHHQSWTPSVWKAALSDLSTETTTPRSLPVTGTVPPDLVGILYKNGSAKFARRGQPYAHWLEGDGAVMRLEFCPNGDVTFTSRFVQTGAFQADETANAITVRGTFGTNKSDGSRNALDWRLKNPANTNAVRIGECVLALSEVGLPCRLDATTLETLGRETFESKFRDGVTAATVGNRVVATCWGLDMPSWHTSGMCPSNCRITRKKDKHHHQQQQQLHPIWSWPVSSNMH